MKLSCLPIPLSDVFQPFYVCFASLRKSFQEDIFVF